MARPKATIACSHVFTSYEAETRRKHFAQCWNQALLELEKQIENKALIHLENDRKKT